MAQLQPPSSLSLQGNLAENWKLWIQKLELLCTASEKAEKSEKYEGIIVAKVSSMRTLKSQMRN